MSRKLEDTFNLPPMDSTFKEELDTDDESVDIPYEDMVITEPQEILNALSTTEKIDSALPTIRGLNNHDKEMDAIAIKAMESFENLAEIAQNSPENYTARMYEVASNMLRTAMDAKNAKVDRKLKIVEMQLKKARLDLDSNRGGGGGDTLQGAEFDRNELLRSIIDGNKDGEEDK